MTPPTATPPPTATDVALHGVCPNCGQPTLFRSLIGFAPKCRACGLDFDAFNVGDGPAAFLTLVIGGLITGLAIWLELAVAPPWWVHVLIWPPLTLAAVLASLRYSKALLFALEYKHRAREGRISDEP